MPEPMDLETFIETVRKMRHYQTAFFRGRSQGDLLEAKRLEKLVDHALDGNLIIPILDTRPDPEPGKQISLFE